MRVPLLGAVVALAVLAACSSSDSPSRDDAGSTTPAVSDGVATSSSSSLSIGGSTTAVQATAAQAKGAACPMTPGPGKHVVTIWHALADESLATLDTVVSMIEQADPSLDIEMVKKGDMFAMGEELAATDLAHWPDIVIGAEFEIRRYSDSGNFIPVDACREAVGESWSGLLAAPKAAFSVDGTLWAAPFAISTPLLYANIAHLKAAGLDPTHLPTTLPELRAQSEQLAAHHIVGLAFDYAEAAGGVWFAEQPAALTGTALADHANGRSGVATSIDLTQPAVTEPLQWLASMVKDGLALPLTDDGRGLANMLQLVDTTKPAAFTLASSASIMVVEDAADSGRFPGAELAVARFPGPVSAVPGAVPGGSGLWMVNSGDPARIAASWATIERLVSPEIQATWAAGTAYAPVVDSAALMPVLIDRWASHPLERVAFDGLRAQPAGPEWVGVAIGPRIEIRARLATLTREVIAGEPVADRAAVAEKDIESILATYAAH